MTGCILDGAQICGTDFTEADVSGASFVGCDVDAALFRWTLCSRETVWPYGAKGRISGVATLGPGLDLREWRLRDRFLYGLDLSGCLLDKADLTGCTLSTAVLDACSLEETSLKQVELQDASLRGVRLRGSRMDHCNLRGVDLTSSTGLPKSMRGCTYDASTVWPSELFTYAVKNGALLIGPGVNLAGADLRRSILCNADLRDANLEGADLRHADLNTADLRGARLEGARLDKAILRGTILDTA